MTIDSSTGFRSARARANAGAAPWLASRRSHAPERAHRTVNYNERMLALRYAAVLALAVWVGGLVALGAVAAPAIFESSRRGRCRTAGCSAARSSARCCAGSIWCSYVCGGVMLVSCGARRARARGRARSPFAPRDCGRDAGGTALYRIRRGTSISTDAEGDRRGCPSSLPENDPRRIEFGRLHSCRPRSSWCRCSAVCCCCSGS